MKVFPEHSLLTNEFNQVVEKLRDGCISNMGQELVENIKPVTDLKLILSLLDCTNEMQEILSSGLPFPSTGYSDLLKEISLLRIENSVLSAIQFHEIRNMMHTVHHVFQFFKTRNNQFNSLRSILETLYYEPAIIKSIDEIIDDTAQVRSSASPELARIRKSLQRARAEADRVYNSVISKYRKQGWLTESEESSRNGRRVIAIFAEQKRSLPGIVHDISATGKTAFLEPQETVAVNNSIQLLEQEEKEEIRRILRELSANLRKHCQLMLRYRTMLGEFDLHRSKALFANKTGSHIPRVSDQPQINLIDAKHPLLLVHNNQLRKPTVPFSLTLNGTNRILVISGPNAGGKTVCMKTAGLLQMMLQSGLPVTAHPDSEFGIFKNIMVDIGDSQSIEYELSTYSSRLRNMKVFLEEVNAKSLFLIDEFGTGTDPNLGGALAEAVLEELNNRKAIGIITTHYLNLKVFADKSEGVVNGSMEFDLKKLKPLYKLVYGKPGSSYTFLVAERSGMPDQIIRNARRKVTRKNLMLEKLLTQVQNEKSLLKNKLQEAEQNAKLLETQIRKYNELSRQNQQRLADAEHKYKKSEAKLSRETEDKFKSFLKEWKKSKDKKEVFEKYYKQFSKKKKKDSPEKIAKKKQEKLKVLKELLSPGSEVRLEGGKTTGIIEQIDNDKAVVLFGRFKTKCELTDLTPVEKESR